MDFSIGIDLVQYLYNSRGKKYSKRDIVARQLVNSGASPTDLDVISGAPPSSVWQRLAVVACEEFDAGMLKITAVTKKSEFTYILA